MYTTAVSAAPSLTLSHPTMRRLHHARYVHHVERQFRDHHLRVVVTTGHVVLMRRATGAAARLHVHTQWRVLGVMDLASVFRIDKLSARCVKIHLFFFVCLFVCLYCLRVCVCVWGGVIS
jgi:hypothetical protein